MLSGLDPNQACEPLGCKEAELRDAVKVTAKMSAMTIFIKDINY
jgi:hypothetical protein